MEDDPLVGHPVLRTIRVLGRSASNVVVLASNIATGQLVAVKLIPRGFDSRQAKYLLRELLNHYELTLAKHPHIVSLLDCFLTRRHLAIVMEYVDGENLQVFLEKAGGCVIEPLARFLFQQLVIALDFCHRRGKVNRNIRPSGLLLQLSDSALPLLKMADFSVSKDTLRNSEPKSQVGTAMYCAPEVLQNFGGAPYDAAAADMWSVGVVLFMMLFGRHPFSRPDDSALPAQQQVIAMFKRVTAPPGSYDGDLYIPHVLPTCVLPGAQPGAPLSLAATDMLRGLLARDPKARLTLAAVQLHEWFRTGLPEGAALLNEVVTAEEAAAGAAAIMQPAVAAQLERMVIQAAAGPAMPAGLTKEPSNRTESGGTGGGGPGGSTRGGGYDLSYDPASGSAALSAQPGQGPPQHPPPQGPLVYRTVTTTGSSDAALQSVSIGSTVAGANPTPLGDLGAQVEPGLAAAAAGSTTGAASEAGATAGLLSSPHWSPVGSTSGAHAAPGGGAGGSGGGAAASATGGCEGAELLADLEAMVMGLPDDDILTAASLDFLMAASFHQNPHDHQHQHHQPTLITQGDAQGGAQQHHEQQQQQHPHEQCRQSYECPEGPAGHPHPHPHPRPHPHPHSCHHHHQQGTSSSFLPEDRSAPASTDNTNSCTFNYPSPPQPSPPPALPPPPQPPAWRPTTQPTPLPSSPAAAAAAPAAPLNNGYGNGGIGAPSRPSDASAHAVPQTLDELLSRPGGSGTRLSGGQDAPHRPAGPSPPHGPPPLQLFASLHSAVAAAGAGDVAAGLLMRLNTESLPSPSTLAVVDAQPFLTNQMHGGGDRRNSSMATIPSTYSMDWCTLSARSQTILLPQGTGAASSGSGSGRGGPGAGGGPGALIQSSLWHRICHEARGALAGVANEAKELGKAAVSGLGGRG